MREKRGRRKEIKNIQSSSNLQLVHAKLCSRSGFAFMQIRRLMHCLLKNAGSWHSSGDELIKRVVAIEGDYVEAHEIIPFKWFCFHADQVFDVSSHQRSWHSSGDELAKRVVAKEGDYFEVRRNNFIVNGVGQDEDFILELLAYEKESVLLISKCVDLDLRRRQCSLCQGKGLEYLQLQDEWSVDIPELQDVCKYFTAKYEKEFVDAALELQSEFNLSHGTDPVDRLL